MTNRWTTQVCPSNFFEVSMVSYYRVWIFRKIMILIYATRWYLPMEHLLTLNEAMTAQWKNRYCQNKQDIWHLDTHHINKCIKANISRSSPEARGQRPAPNFNRPVNTTDASLTSSKKDLSYLYLPYLCGYHNSSIIFVLKIEQIHFTTCCWV